jgi:hypothetical protein
VIFLRVNIAQRSCWFLFLSSNEFKSEWNRTSYVTHSDSSICLPLEQSRLKQQSSSPLLVASYVSLQYTVFQMQSVLLIIAYICGRQIFWRKPCLVRAKNILRESEIIIFYSRKYAFWNKSSKENVGYQWDLCVCVSVCYILFFTLNCCWETLCRLMSSNTTPCLTVEDFIEPYYIFCIVISIWKRPWTCRKTDY